jgi:signal recognition particle GTPase
MTGQDAVRSAEEFHKRVGITGVILTKMDGDARGGAALSIKQVIGQPVNLSASAKNTTLSSRFILTESRRESRNGRCSVAYRRSSG